MERVSEKKPVKTTELADRELEAATGGAYKYYGFVAVLPGTTGRNAQFWFVSTT